MTEQQPLLVSVYIPTRNRSGLLARAIDSVLRQDYGPVEILVVDDASEDETEQVVMSIAKEASTGKHVSYLRLSDPAGACVARNFAINMANGILITGLDDDDYFLPNRISSLVSAFDPALCAFVFDGYVRETNLPDGRLRRATIPLNRSVGLRDLLKRNIVGNQVLTLTSRIRDVGGFDERLPAWQDYDLWLRLLKTFGNGISARGISYVHSVDILRERISGDKAKIKRAFDLFMAKHSEYAERELSLCLRLAKACYGIDALSLSDIPKLVRLGEPRYVLFALYSYLVRRCSRNTA